MELHFLPLSTWIGSTTTAVIFSSWMAFLASSITPSSANLTLSSPPLAFKAPRALPFPAPNGWVKDTK
ncbi:hypothetical protein L484_017783 [Morus notabilis]|uniref:Uncharacterized protein n=1 Tax=Morus notabilis TaxID=981085 RepID=W9RRQ3_9ROSA|nr:hypothetical protein L484_017783 [Morus notabilis]